MKSIKLSEDEKTRLYKLMSLAGRQYARALIELATLNEEYGHIFAPPAIRYLPNYAHTDVEVATMVRRYFLHDMLRLWKPNQSLHSLGAMAENQFNSRTWLRDVYEAAVEHEAKEHRNKR